MDQRPSIAARWQRAARSGGGGEVDPVAGLGSSPAEADCEVGLPDTGWSDHEHVGGGLEIAAGRELLDEFAVDTRSGIEVEVGQRRGCRQRGEPQPSGELAGLGGLDLTGQQMLQRSGGRPLLGFSLGKHAGQVLSCCGELQRSEMTAQLLIEAALRARHRGG